VSGQALFPLYVFTLCKEHIVRLIFGIVTCNNVCFHMAVLSLGRHAGSVKFCHTNSKAWKLTVCNYI
jgi:hypothetical protein